MIKSTNFKQANRLSLLSELLSSHIMEPEFDKQIVTCHELPILRSLLEIKLHFIKNNVHSPICYPINFILNEVSLNTIDEVCYIFDFALTIQIDTSQYVILLCYIKENLLQKLESPLLLCYTKLLNVALSLCRFERERNVFINFIEVNHFNVVIANLINTDSTEITNYLNVNILSKYLKLKCESSTYLLKLIWENSLELKKLDVLCAVPQFFIICDSNFSLIKEESFWYLLQDCLNCTSSNSQKQALYLLKEAINLIRSLDLFATSSCVVTWDKQCKQEIDTAWENLFVLYEVVREKQLHLIEPTYQLISTIKVLHSSWLISIFKLLLFHPHNAVSSYSILDILKSDWYTDINVFETIISCVLCAINNIDFTQNDEIWSNLSIFTDNLNEKQFMIILQASTHVSWVPPICYMFYKNAFNDNVNVCVSIDLIVKILSNMKRLPHKYIRKECILLVYSFVKKSYPILTFNDFITLNSIEFEDKLLFMSLVGFPIHAPDIKETVSSWFYNESINLRYITIVLKIVYSMANEQIDIFLYESFTHRKFNVIIADRLCFYLYSKNINTMPYLKSRLINISDKDDTYLKDVAPLLLSKSEDCNDILETCKGILLNDESNCSQVEIAFAIINVCTNEYYVCNLEKILEKWREKILFGMKCNANICVSFLQLYTRNIFSSNQPIRLKQLVQITTIFEKLLDTQDSIIVPEIFAQLYFVFNFCEEIVSALTFLDICVRKLHELKGGDIFKRATKNFISSIVLNNKILNNEQHIIEKCTSILWILYDLAISCENVAHSLSLHLYKLSELRPNVAVTFIPIAIELLLYGDTLKKDQRAEYAVCQSIFKNKEDQAENPNMKKIAVRGLAIKYIQNILNCKLVTKEHLKERADRIASLLLQKYSKYFNKRYFSDSQIHLNKLRILQGLLMVHIHIEEERQPLIDTLLNSLCIESHQISIKFLIIWLLVRLLDEKENCLEIITNTIDQTSKMHTSTIIAFVPILYHLAVLKNDDEFFIKTFETMLPWTMGAHFNLRLYAQEGFKKLYKAVEASGHHNVSVKFKETLNCITNVLTRTERNIDIIDNYIFEIFDPNANFNLETIYYVIPYITNVTYDEYENILLVLNCCIDHGLQDHLNQWRIVQIKTIKHTKNDTNNSLIQKKITPQKTVNRKTGELVVIASLIKKIPNLGGLSRTCEIFGVKQLAINSISVIKSHEFQSLSMSSENWMDIIEIKTDQLKNFLLNMKEMGYSVIGAEQTSDSVKLNNFSFPVKTVLILGNEKEGIPPNLLSLIDTCVEIPQLGLVRSLNVHVAAATFIWEYTKVHMSV